MWIFTPDVAYNLDRYRCFWVDNDPEARLYLLPEHSDEPDYIQFDCNESAIRSFDAAVRGLLKGARTLLVQEVYDGFSERPRLKSEYDTEYTTDISETESGTEISDPRLDGRRMFYIKESKTRS